MATTKPVSVSDALLRHISASGPSTVEALAPALDVSPAEIERTVSALFAAGLLEVRGDLIKLSPSKVGQRSSLHHAARRLGDAAAEHESLPQNQLVRTAEFDRALSDESTVIVGRRGTGKTLLASQLVARSEGYYSGSIQVDTALAASHILNQLRDCDDPFSKVRVAEHGWRAWVWAEVLKLLIEQRRVAVELLPPDLQDQSRAPSGVHLSKLYEWVHSEELEFYGYRSRGSSVVGKALNSAMEALERGGPFLVVIDTLERQPVHDDLHEALAAGQLWVGFSLPRELRGLLVIKCFARAEIFNYALLRAVPNPMKLTASVVHLRWNSKDLAELAARRLDDVFSRYAPPAGSNRRSSTLRWQESSQSLAELLPETITSPVGLHEPAFLYLLRHTQMTPRHVIMALRYILNSTSEMRDSQTVSQNSFVMGISRLAQPLAYETINAARDVYPQIEGVIKLLERTSQVFPGKLLDRIWHQGGRAIQGDEAIWNRDIFREVLVDSGILGVVVEETARYVHAAFQFSSDRKIVLSERSICAVHPIFSAYLRLPPHSVPVLPRISDPARSDA